MPKKKRGETQQTAAPTAQATADQQPAPEQAKKLHEHFLRDSAVMIAGISGLLYLANHLYGGAYLGAVGVSLGFQGVGLSNLALMPLFSVFLLASNTLGTYRMLTHKGVLIADIISVITLLILLCLPLMTALEHGATEDLALGLGLAVAWTVALIAWMRFVRPHHVDILKEFEELQPHATKPTEDADRIKYEKARARAASVRLRIILSCAHASAVVYLTTLGRNDCLTLVASKNHKEWRVLDPTGPARMPVYWIGDRYIYITNDGKECLVHVQIAGVEQARRNCTPVIATLSR
jgi:hypothetical protein